MKNGCGVPLCQGPSCWPNVAMCKKHFQPHHEAIEVRRCADPFDPPRVGGNIEMKFNNVNWFWFRGSWRPSQDTLVK